MISAVFNEEMKMKNFTVDKDGFCGTYYPLDHSDHAFIAMLGDDTDDLFAKTGAKWLKQRGYAVLTMAPSKKDYGHHNYPLERFEKAIAFLKKEGYKKIGIIGASTTGMLALIAASYYPDITMTLVFSPSDFVMEGFYRDGKDGAQERPGNGESTVSKDGRPLPYLPFAYRHPEYWRKIREETKGSGNFISTIGLFDESERCHPLEEEEKIRIEKIRGHIVFIGAKDDVLWDTCRYIRRMEERLSSREHSCTYDALTYEYGTHFIFPESLMKMLLPVGSKFLIGLAFCSARQHPKECRETRIDIDRRLAEILENW